MSEARADCAEIDRAGPRRLRPKHLAQLVAIAVVIGLLGLLAWRVARGEAGGGFVAAIRAGERPIAPDFALPVIWERDETWPPQARPALTDGTDHSIGVVSKDDLEVGIRAALKDAS